MTASSHQPDERPPSPRRPAVQAVVDAIQLFFRLEAASGIVLFAAALLALGWANSPFADLHHRLFETTWGALPSLHHTINEGLMTLFFFVVGMEIKRELVAGELRTVNRALLPAIAAAGGMIVPALVFLVFNAGQPGQAGWGIPMATDIAFAIGCLRLLGNRVPHALVVFVMALAIFDDIGGIVVIALFYGSGLQLAWLSLAVAAALVLLLMNRFGLRHGVLYLSAGIALWLGFQRGGIHPTIAGVVVGLVIPLRGEDAPLERFLHALHPWVAFGIMPLFALANSGVRFIDVGLPALIGPVALGTTLGLALGKPLGIVAATAVAVKAGLAERPGGARWMTIFGASVVAGIGFTVALFIAALAYPRDAALLDQAKAGVVFGSLVAGLAGVALLRCRPAQAPPAPQS